MGLRWRRGWSHLLCIRLHYLGGRNEDAHACDGDQSAFHRLPPFEEQHAQKIMRHAAAWCTNQARRGSRKRPDPLCREAQGRPARTTRACRREAALRVVRGAWSRAVRIAVSIAAVAVSIAVIAVKAIRTVIAPPTPPWAPPTSVWPAYPGHALMQGDVARYGREIGHGHR